MSKQTIKNLILKSIDQAPYADRIKRVALFGSYLSGQEKDDSDVDLLIEFSQPIGFFKFVGLQKYFQNQLARNVDLVTPDSLSKYFRDEVLRQAEEIYAR